MLDQTYYWEDEKYRKIAADVNEWPVARVIFWHTIKDNGRYLPTSRGYVIDPTVQELSALKKYIVYDIFKGGDDYQYLGRERSVI